VDSAGLGQLSIAENIQDVQDSSKVV